MWSIIPDINNLYDSVALSKQFNTSFEYNDFFIPSVYEDDEELERRINVYASLDRKNNNDTLHGVFYDIVSTSKDSIIRERSRNLCEKSLEIASRLNCKGVVFHTGLIAGLNTKSYVDEWVNEMSKYISYLAKKYPNLNIYIENTFEQSPAPLISLMKACEGIDNISLCLDYSHAVLTSTNINEWIENMAPYISHIHLNDNDLLSDLHEIPGRGKIDFDELKCLIAPIISNKPINILLELTGCKRQKEALEFMEKL